MASLRQALIAAGDVELQQFVGRETLDLLKAWGDQAITAPRLADLLLARYGASLLEIPELRELVILSLPRAEAERLGLKLGVSDSADPYDAVISRARHVGKGNEDLYEFFGAECPKPAQSILDPSNETVSPAYPLRDYQRDVVRKTLSALGKGPRRVLLHLPTGAGKTRTAMSVLASLLCGFEHGELVVWLAHSEELCDQAAEEFERAWHNLGNRPIGLFRFYGAHEVDLANIKDGLVIGGLSKLYSRSLRDQSAFLSLKRNVATVVMDEAHQAIAPTYQHLIEMLAPAAGGVQLLGLSATPGRSRLDIDEDERLANFFERRKVTLDVTGFDSPISFLEAHQYLASASYINIPYSPKTTLSEIEQRKLEETLDLPPSVITRLGEDEQRNLLILDAVKKEFEAGSKILLFACSVKHAEVLTDVLEFRGIRAGLVTGSTPRAERQSRLESFRSDDPAAINVLVNCEVLTTGFDAPKTNVAIIARPTSSVVLFSQMCGRALRGPRSGGNAMSRIYTVVDQLPGFSSASDGFGYWNDIWTD